MRFKQWIDKSLFPNTQHNFRCFLIGLIAVVSSPVLIPLIVLYMFYKAIEELGWIIVGGNQP